MPSSKSALAITTEPSGERKYARSSRRAINSV
jgi:hypothetical protein